MSLPVGLCTDPKCRYQEPHRHGFACDKKCECIGIGPTPRPMTPDTVFTCDWGDCERETVAERLDDDPRHHGGWLAVCSWHAGWDDYEHGPPR